VANGGAETRPVETGRRRHRLRLSVLRQLHRPTLTGRGEQTGDFVETCQRLVAIDLALDLVGDDVDPLANMIEDHQGVEPRQHGHRQLEPVDGTVREPLQHPHQIVAKESDKAAGKRQRAAVGFDAADDLVQTFQRRARQALRLALSCYFESVRIEAVDLGRAGTEKAVPRNLVTTGDALEQKAEGRGRGQTPIDPERCQAVGQKLPQVRGGFSGLAQTPPSSPKISRPASNGKSSPVINRNWETA
jgi:hypothetical protein